MGPVARPEVARELACAVVGQWGQLGRGAGAARGSTSALALDRTVASRHAFAVRHRAGQRPPRRDEAPAVAWRGGVQLGGTVVFCDAGRARDLVFLSHAHVAGRAAHGKVIASARTLALLSARGVTVASSALPLRSGRPLSLGALRLELFPSGHVPGAASLLLVEPSGRRIAYGGDVNPVLALAEPAEVREADVLVLEAPLAALAARLPPRAEAHAELCDTVRSALAAGRTPVVLAPPLGVAQEAQRVLGLAGIALRAHPAVRDWSNACAAVGVALPPLARPGRRRGEPAALLWPLELAASRALARAERPLLVALSGQALDPRYATRMGVDRAIALSDHADLPSLVEYVRQTGASQVHVTAGFCPALVAALASVKASAHPLGPPRQMELLL